MGFTEQVNYQCLQDTHGLTGEKRIHTIITSKSQRKCRLSGPMERIHRAEQRRLGVLRQDAQSSLTEVASEQRMKVREQVTQL